MTTECGCIPPQQLQLTPKQMEDGPVICGNCGDEFHNLAEETPDED